MKQNLILLILDLYLSLVLLNVYEGVKNNYLVFL